ncbi:pectinesterase inhibitor 10-like protein [Tanacetum coccineum]
MWSNNLPYTLLQLTVMSSKAGAIQTKMNRPGSKDFGLVMSDMQTWVSAALKDEDTCSEGFTNDLKMKNVVRGKVGNVVYLTTKALGLISSYASVHG